MMHDVSFKDIAFTPAELAEATGVSTETQRDWRRRGHIKMIGTRSSSNRWKYDFGDALWLHLMAAFAAKGVELQYAETFAIASGHGVVAWKLAELLSEGKVPGAPHTDSNIPRYGVARLVEQSDRSDKDTDWMIRKAWKIDVEDGPGDSVCILLDYKSIAQQLPSLFGASNLPALVSLATMYREIDAQEMSEG